MKPNFRISIYLDSRRAKENKKYPVKLRVYDTQKKKQVLYPTKFEYTEKAFNSIWKTVKTRDEHKNDKAQLDSIIKQAEQAAKKIIPFDFELFEKKLYRKAGDGTNVCYHYDEIIKLLRSRGQIGNAGNYESSKKSLTYIAKEYKGLEFSKLSFFDITVNWLEDYEYFMSEKEQRSLTTVSMYIRALRAIFNKAIDEKEFSRHEHYPFGEKRYVIPASQKVKKALSVIQIKKLLNVTPEYKEQEKARDFWFLSYACNGMNIKDIALLKYKNITNGKFEFVRAKTKKTGKKNIKPIVIYLNSYIEGIINKYGNDREPNNYVFPILEQGLNPEKQQKRIKNFTRFINQHLKKLCKANDLPADISTYWARHSYSTLAIRKGASMEFVQESLGHSNLKTTQNYFAGFDSEAKKEFAQGVMDF